jgi:hypothetical protein
MRRVTIGVARNGPSVFSFPAFLVRRPFLCQLPYPAARDGYFFNLRQKDAPSDAEIT